MIWERRSPECVLRSLGMKQKNICMRSFKLEAKVSLDTWFISSLTIFLRALSTISKASTNIKTFSNTNGITS